MSESGERETREAPPASGYVLGLQAQMACLWEATARKPGNVHRYRDFADTGYLDFLTSAAAIGPILAQAPGNTLGATVLEAVQRTRGVARGNTNLGIILLLAPLAKASGEGEPLRPVAGYRAAVERVLADSTVEDAAMVYRAIAMSGAGGLGKVAEQDVGAAPSVSLREAMALAADRDLIARQYAYGFAEVFDEGAPAVLAGIARTGCLERGIIDAHLHLMSRYPDSLIQRKRGIADARESADRAREVLAAGWPERASGREALVALDGWLRAEGHKRNPGTTADMIAASLFVLLRQRDLMLPLALPWGLAEEM